MPHLAPISWILTLLVFWFLLAALISFMWWQQPINIKLPYKSAPLNMPSWNWYSA